MDLNRRSFIAGLGSLAIGFRFRRQLNQQLDRVIDELEAESAAWASEPQTPDQLPAAAEIYVRPQHAFRPERLLVSTLIAKDFLIEDISIGGQEQLAPGVAIPASIFAAVEPDGFLSLDAAAPGADIRFRVRYVGAGRAARFQAVLIGSAIDLEPRTPPVVPGMLAHLMAGRRRVMLPIDSGLEIAA